MVFLLSRLTYTGEHMHRPCGTNAVIMWRSAAGRAAQVGAFTAMADVADTVIMHELGSARAQHAELHVWRSVLPCCMVQLQLPCSRGEVRLHIDGSLQMAQAPCCTVASVVLC